VNEYKLENYENGVATYKVELVPERTGMYQVGTRIFPKHPDLPHRQDFPLVKWL
jgi:phosphorylase/glycogen(starch) synthase